MASIDNFEITNVEEQFSDVREVGTLIIKQMDSELIRALVESSVSTGASVYTTVDGKMVNIGHVTDIHFGKGKKMFPASYSVKLTSVLEMSSVYIARLKGESVRMVPRHLNNRVAYFELKSA